MDPRPVLYFVSDVHLGRGPPKAEAQKRERLIGLMDRVQEAGGSLYILGDLFDFWFEYRTVIPRAAFGILARLEGLAAAGVPVRYLGGNHDFWLCDFLARETGVEVLEDGALVSAQNQTLRLFHGDGLGPGDTGYKILKRVFRNPLAIRLFRWIHPDLGIGMALRTSHVSRDHTMDQPVDVDRIHTHVALPEFNRGATAVLMGHHHVPELRRGKEGTFMILGDWFKAYTCGRLKDGNLELVRWPDI